MRRPKQIVKAFFACETAEGRESGSLVRPENPRQLYPFEALRKGHRLGKHWRGCNHCGRYVPPDCPRVEWRVPGRRTLLMHQYCYFKVYAERGAEELFGRDFFADDEDVQRERRQKRERAIEALTRGVRNRAVPRES